MLLLVVGMLNRLRVEDYRARELFYYLKGGRVDYGDEHSKICGHSQFGKVYEQGMRGDKCLFGSGLIGFISVSFFLKLL